jgi:hypothetical protein
VDLPTFGRPTTATSGNASDTVGDSGFTWSILIAPGGPTRCPPRDQAPARFSIRPEEVR